MLINVMLHLAEKEKKGEQVVDDKNAVRFENE